MIKIDLITGFLGSGKTTFIKKYVNYLLEEDIRVGIIENDFGAVNVDMMLLHDLLSNQCEIEMINGAGDRGSHTRRLKTKLIAMKMRGVNRVIMEPSGIYDVDEFFDILHEEPLNQWYKIGNVVTIVDSHIAPELSKQARYLLATQIFYAGKIILSKVQDASPQTIENTVKYINESLQMFHAQKKNEEDLLIKDWQYLTRDDYLEIKNSGYHQGSLEKFWFDYQEVFQTLYFMNKKITKEQLPDIVTNIFNDHQCGNVLRIKGFIKDSEIWYELNAMKNHLEFKEIEKGQEIIIIIGENLHEQVIERYF